MHSLSIYHVKNFYWAAMVRSNTSLYLLSYTLDLNYDLS